MPISNNQPAVSISINGLTPNQARLKRAYGYVFQAPALLLWRTVERNVALPLEIIGMNQPERIKRVARTLEMVNLSGFEKNIPGNFPAACSNAPQSQEHWLLMPICS